MITRASLIFFILVSVLHSQSIFAQVITCTRSNLDSFRNAAQTLDKKTPQMAGKLTACASYADEVSFWVSFYYGTSRDKSVRPGGIQTSSISLPGPAGDLRAARAASKNSKWSDARVRYESYLSKRPTDFQIKIEREFTLIWEEKYLDAEKSFDELLKSKLPPQIQNEAMLGKKLAIAMQNSKASVEKSKTSGDGAKVAVPFGSLDQGNEGWVNVPSIALRDGSDTLQKLSLGVKTQFANTGLYDDHSFFELVGTRVVSNTSGLRSHAQVVGVAAGSKLDFGQGYQLIGKLGYFGVANGLFHGQIKSQFSWNPEMKFAVGISRDPLFLIVPINLNDQNLARNSVFSEISWRQILETRYEISRESVYEAHEKFDLNVRWNLGGGVQRLVNGPKQNGTATNLLVLSSFEHHPRASAFYKTQERVNIIRLGYEIDSLNPSTFLSAVKFQVIAGTAFVKSRYPKGGSSQVGVWGARAFSSQYWSKAFSSSLAAEHQAAASDVNESILQRKSVLSASLNVNL